MVSIRPTERRIPTRVDGSLWSERIAMTRLHVNGDALANGAGGPRLSAEERFLRLKKELHQQLISGMDLTTVGTMDEKELRLEVRRAAEELCRLRSDLLNLNERERLVNE